LAALIKEDYVEAKLQAESQLDLNEEIGDVIGSTTPLIVLGHVAFARSEHTEARRYYLRCLKISEEVRFHYAIQTSSKYLGKVALSMGEIAEAEKYLVQSLIISKEIGFVRDIINLIYEFARLWVAQDNSEQAVELIAFVLQHPASYESRMLEGRIRDSAKDLLTKLEDELPLEVYKMALERGQELDLDEIITELVNPERIPG
jgi:tetratricopeptide (TPR) repeat protein